jgi:hypothetical protein
MAGPPALFIGGELVGGLSGNSQIDLQQEIASGNLFERLKQLGVAYGPRAFAEKK